MEKCLDTECSRCKSLSIFVTDDKELVNEYHNTSHLGVFSGTHYDESKREMFVSLSGVLQSK